MPLPLAGSPGLAVVGALLGGGRPARRRGRLRASSIPGGAAGDRRLTGRHRRPPSGDAALPSNRALALEVTPAATLATVLELRDAAGVLLGQLLGRGRREPRAAQRRHPTRRALPDRGPARPDRKKPPAAPTTRPSGSYALLVREVALGAGDEREPNDSLETATALAPAHAAPEMAGYFGTPRDRDFYRVPHRRGFRVDGGFRLPDATLVAHRLPHRLRPRRP